MKLTTPPLSPKVIAQLVDLNIHTLADLQATNPCYAFLLLKQSGLSVTKSVFWQLVALYSLKSVQDLSEQERQFWEQQLHEMPPVAIFPPQNEMVQFMQAALFQAALAAELGKCLWVLLWFIKATLLLKHIIVAWWIAISAITRKFRLWQWLVKFWVTIA